uniref:Spondin-2 n=1 Tax=Hirondellea gigas TaxID=1518452 RepID=A0A6A7FVQ0_9CRUS
MVAPCSESCRQNNKVTMGSHSPSKYRHHTFLSFVPVVLCVVLFAAPSALIEVVYAGTATGHTPPEEGGCPSEQLAQYRVVFNTHWSREEFPKHYPQWRPHAQWTKLLGVSHSGEHTLFREGQRASAALKEFTETGRSDQLDGVTYSSQGTLVLDAFYAPAITEGVGQTQAKFFADGNHSRISMVAKIVPSPDWFVGVDSLQLCAAGHWINATSIQLSPMDAGTDQGLAFTSPSWQLSPPDPVTRITHTSPSHPAASFAYPHRTSLPPLASLSIVKIREYRLVNPSRVQVPLRVYSSEHSEENSGQLSTTERHTSNDKYSYSEHDHNSHNKDEIYQQKLNKAEEQNSVMIEHSNSVLDQTSTADTSKGHSYDSPSHDRLYPYITSNEVTRTLSEPSMARVSTIEEQQQQLNSNRPSHDSPLRHHIYSSDDISITFEAHGASQDPQQQNSGENQEISNDVTDTGERATNSEQDLSYNEVLPREQYDRQAAKASQQHHQKLQQLLQEKRRKLKEKKRKHKERKLAAAQRRGGAKRGRSDGGERGLERARRRKYKMSNLTSIPKGDAMSVIDSIVETYQRDQRRKRRQQRREERRRRRMLNRMNGVTPRRGKEAVDCTVGEWTIWSSCSKTCGIGEQVRKREVTQQPRRGGLKCPTVTETTWCGSARDCHRDYFRW